jgi:hypothetical protein
MSTLIASAAKTASNTARNFASRSRITNRNRPRSSPISMSRFRACWATQSPTGCGVTPSTRTRRVATSITNSTYSRFNNTVSTVKQVHRQHTGGLGPQELPPGKRRPPWCRINPAAVQDGPHGARPHPESEPAQLAVDPPVARGRVLPGQPQHQRAKLRRHTQTATPMWVRPAAPDQVLMGASSVAGPHEHSAPAGAGQQPHEPGQHRAICPVNLRSGHLASQHGHFVA